ncbi:M23 family peptidase, partial [Helicobacter pylori]|nr:M23 family peptidase [Helicobacter pylori]
MPQNQLMITIIDESGSKQLKFSKKLKRNLIIFVVIFLLIVGLGV